MSSKTPPTHRDVITVVRDPRTPLGKIFAVDGSKSAQVQVGLGIAIQRAVPDATAMAKLLRTVGEDPHAAIINAGFPDIAVGEEFLILSESQLRSKLKTPQSDARPTGVHIVKHGGKPIKAVGRFKENTCPSTWQLLDRDVDQHTPPEYSELNYSDWVNKLESILPGLSQAAQVRVPSSSSRVQRGGKPVAPQNTHTWVQIENPDDVERMRGIITARCIDQGMHWPKPRFSRKNPDEVVGSGTGLPLDASVWVRGRLVFCGKPTVPSKNGWSLKPVTPAITRGGRLNTTKIGAPDLVKLNRVSALQDGQYQWTMTGNGCLTLCAHDLTMATELELQDGRVMSVREALEMLPPQGKLRCQTPFRASTSYAAFLGQGSDGKPFVHDSGTSTTHWLCDEDAVDAGFTPSYDAAPSLQSIIDQLAPLSVELIEQSYPDKVMNLPQDDQERFFRWLKAKNQEVTKTLFNSSLKEAVSRKKNLLVNKATNNRHAILVRDEDVALMTQEAEHVIVSKSEVGTLVQWGDALAQVREASPDDMHAIGHADVPPPMQVVMKVLKPVDIRALVERFVVFQRTSRDGRVNVAVPQSVIDMLFMATDHSAPKVHGLVNHPLVVNKDHVVNMQGRDARTGLFFAGERWSDLRPFNRKEAKVALTRIFDALFSEFAFTSDLDRDMAVALLFTAIQRRILPTAPGFALLAHMQSSGKTTLARIVHLVVTGKEIPVATFPEGDEVEAEKRVISMLLNAPTMITLDNLTDGITFRSAVLARAITSSTIQGRILGASRDVVLPTNTTWVLTGNNLSMGADEATRWLPIWLDAKTAKPHQRQFKHQDLHTHVLSKRKQVIRDVLGVVWGHLKEGLPNQSKTRYPQWDYVVRQSLIWAGARDIQDAVDVATSSSGAAQAEAAVLACLFEKFALAKFSASDVIAAIPAYPGSNTEWGGDLIEGLGRLRCKNPQNATSLGRALHSLSGRPIITSHGTLTLRKFIRDGKTRYQIGVT